MTKQIISKVVSYYRSDGVTGVGRQVFRRIVHAIRLKTFRPYVIKKTMYGDTVSLLIADLCSQSWYDRDHDWPELRWLKENLVSEEDIIVDCGAHHGLTTILFSLWAHRGAVYGYEAHPRNAEIATHNLSLNGITSARVLQRAVGARSGMINISNHSNAAITDGNSAHCIAVPLVTLDAELASLAPTLLKIDVEGEEVNVLRGASEILKRSPKLDIEIHCGLHADAVHEVETLFNLIQPDKYAMHIQLDVDGPIVPFDSRFHTYQYIARFPVVHLFCLPRDNSNHGAR
jgi:FkbM family methyltransferase